MTRRQIRTAIGRAALGVAGLAAGAASTVLFPPAALPLCVGAGMTTFVLGCRSALRIARVDDLVFAHRPTWNAPDPPIPLLSERSAIARRQSLSLVEAASESRSGHRRDRNSGRTGVQTPAS